MNRRFYYESKLRRSGYENTARVCCSFFLFFVLRSGLGEDGDVSGPMKALHSYV